MAKIRDFLFHPSERIVAQLKSGKNKDEKARSLLLTNMKVIKVTKDGKKSNYKDVSLNHISSIEHYKEATSVGKIIIGFLFLIITGISSYFVFDYLSYYGYIDWFFLGIAGIALLIGLVLLIKGFSTKSEIKIYTSTDTAILNFSIKSSAMSVEAAKFIAKVHALSNHMNGTSKPYPPIDHINMVSQMTQSSGNSGTQQVQSQFQNPSLSNTTPTNSISTNSTTTNSIPTNMVENQQPIVSTNSPNEFGDHFSFVEEDIKIPEPPIISTSSSSPQNNPKGFGDHFSFVEEESNDNNEQDDDKWSFGDEDFTITPEEPKINPNVKPKDTWSFGDDEFRLDDLNTPEIPGFKKLCPKCGAEIDSNEKFCKNCRN